MKTGRNDPCPCGSGKKYKRCCMDSVAKQQSEIRDDIHQVVAMNPDLTLDELNLVAQQKINNRNDQPHPDFCGLSPTQIYNWMYAPLSELKGLTINIPEDLTICPVMRYLQLIIDEAIELGGSFKSTSKGNLPAKLVKKASELLPEFAIAEYDTIAGISEHTGSNEDKFNALHYARILAELAGIIYHRSGRFHVKKDAQKQYLAHGVGTFFLPMLEVAANDFEWGYFDSLNDENDIQLFWVYMLWRLQKHGSIEQLVDDVIIAFPPILEQLPDDLYFSSEKQLDCLIEFRFVIRFLQFWGFVTVNPKRYDENQQRIPRKANIQPLLRQTFKFSV